MPVVERKQPLVTGVNASRTSATRSRSPIASGVSIVISRRRARRARRAAAEGEEHAGDPRQRPDAAARRGRVPRRPATRRAGELAKAGVTFAFSTGDSANVAHAALPGGDVGGVGPRTRRRAQGADDRRREDPRRRRPRRQPRARQDREPVHREGDPLEIKTQITHVVIAGATSASTTSTRELYRAYIEQAVDRMQRARRRVAS